MSERTPLRITLDAADVRKFLGTLERIAVALEAANEANLLLAALVAGDDAQGPLIRHAMSAAVEDARPGIERDMLRRRAEADIPTMTIEEVGGVAPNNVIRTNLPPGEEWRAR